MYIIGMTLEDYKRSHILMSGCKYLTPNGKSFVHLYAKNMHKLCIMFHLLYLRSDITKTTVSMQIFLLVFIGSKFTESSEPRWSGGRRKREQWKINSTFLKTVLEHSRSLYILKLAHFHRKSWTWWHNETPNLMI